jgi:hypothetical protein
MDNIIIVMGVIGLVGIAIAALYYFMNLSKDKQIQMVREWLTYTVMIAEKELGSGTGQLKLRYVYDLFLSKFKYLSLVMSFEQFSLLVDDALVLMRNAIANNKQIENYINNK